MLDLGEPEAVLRFKRDAFFSDAQSVHSIRTQVDHFRIVAEDAALFKYLKHISSDMRWSIIKYVIDRLLRSASTAAGFQSIFWTLRSIATGVATIIKRVDEGSDQRNQELANGLMKVKCGGM